MSEPATPDASPVPSIALDALIARYDALLFDAYGVLVHATGAMPGAAELLLRLERIGKPYQVITNDASKLPETAAERYRGFGLQLDTGHLLTSGLLLQEHFAAYGLQGARCAVLGTPDCDQYGARAGGRVVPVSSDFAVLVVGDQSGFAFLETVDAAITSLYRLIDAGERVHLVLPNPDLVFSRGVHSFGIAAGSVAMLFDAALRRRYRDKPTPQFARLGKPHPQLYEEAMHRCGTRNVAMIGDQLETDIAGANACGIDSVLLATGVSADDLAGLPPALRPTWRLGSLSAPPEHSRHST